MITKRPCLLFTLLASLTLAVFPTLAHAETLEFDTSVECKETTSVAPNGVVLLTHGLNQDPDTMTELQQLVTEAGFHYCLLRLAGHREEDGCSYRSKRSTWQKQIHAAHQSIVTQYPELPRFAIGYSLGAALTVWYAQHQEQAPFERLVLLAPPFGLRTSIQLIRPLLPLRYLHLRLPSAAPRAYRFCSSTDLTAYHAAVRLVDAVADVDQRLSETPTLIFMREDDNLNDAEKLKRWMKKNELTTWNLVVLPPTPKRHPLPAHLIIDQASLGSDLWKQLSDQLVAFLSNHTAKPTPPHPRHRASDADEEPQ